MLAPQAWGPDFHRQHPYKEAKHSGLHLKTSAQGVERRGSRSYPSKIGKFEYREKHHLKKQVENKCFCSIIE